MLLGNMPHNHLILHFCHENVIHAFCKKNQHDLTYVTQTVMLKVHLVLGKMPAYRTI